MYYLLKLEKIEKRLVQQKTPPTKINNCIEIENENRFKKSEETSDRKLIDIIDKQERCEIKSTWKPQVSIQAQKMKVLMHETFTRKKRLDLEKMEKGKESNSFHCERECIRKRKPKKTAGFEIF